MPRAVVCDVDGVEVSVETAIGLRNQAHAIGEPVPDFRCIACAAAVRPHRAGGGAAAHFEHLERNPLCHLSDPAPG